MTIGLFALGMLIAAAGLGMVGFGIPINEFSLGNTLIIAGTVAVVGGMLMIGIAIMVRQLIRLNDALVSKPAARMGRAGDFFEAAPARETAPAREAAPARQAPWRPPFPQPHRADNQERDHRLGDARFSPVSVDALEEQIMERPRQTFSPPSRLGGDPQLVEAAEEAPLSPRVVPRPRAGAPAITDFPAEPKAWSPNPARPAAAPRNGAAELARAPAPERPAAAAAESWFNGPRPATPETLEPRGEPAAIPRGRDEMPNGAPRGHAPAPAPAQHAPERRPLAILKSGIVDGMAYTLYTDGSIEAELAEGVVRFGSIEELRTHLEKSA